MYRVYYVVGQSTRRQRNKASGVEQLHEPEGNGVARKY